MADKKYTLLSATRFDISTDVDDEGEIIHLDQSYIEVVYNSVDVDHVVEEVSQLKFYIMDYNRIIVIQDTKEFLINYYKE